MENGEALFLHLRIYHLEDSGMYGGLLGIDVRDNMCGEIVYEYNQQKEFGGWRFSAEDFATIGAKESRSRRGKSRLKGASELWRERTHAQYQAINQTLKS